MCYVILINQIKLPFVRSDNWSDKLPQFKLIDFDKFLEHFQEIKNKRKRTKRQSSSIIYPLCQLLSPRNTLTQTLSPKDLKWGLVEISLKTEISASTKLSILWSKIQLYVSAIPNWPHHQNFEFIRTLSWIAWCGRFDSAEKD